MIALFNYQKSDDLFKHSKKIFTEESYPIATLKVITIVPVFLALLQDLHNAISPRRSQNKFLNQVKTRVYSNLKTLKNYIKTHRSEIIILLATVRIAFIIAKVLKKSDPLNPKEECEQINPDNLNSLDKETDELLNYIYPTEKGYLRFCKNDQKKALWLRSRADHNNALNPNLAIHLLSHYAKNFDFRIGSFLELDDMCSQIDSALEMGNLHTLLINAHGSEKSITLGAELEHKRLIYNWKNNQFEMQEYTQQGQKILTTITSTVKQCFEKLPKNTKIILMSCSTGGDVKESSENSFAAGLAKLIKRKVTASKSPLTPVTSFFGSGQDAQFHFVDLFYNKDHIRDRDIDFIRHFDEDGKLENKKMLSLWYYLTHFSSNTHLAIKYLLRSLLILSLVGLYIYKLNMKLKKIKADLEFRNLPITMMRFYKDLIFSIPSKIKAYKVKNKNNYIKKIEFIAAGILFFDFLHAGTHPRIIFNYYKFLINTLKSSFLN